MKKTFVQITIYKLLVLVLIFMLFSCTKENVSEVIPTFDVEVSFQDEYQDAQQYFLNVSIDGKRFDQGQALSLDNGKYQGIHRFESGQTYYLRIEAIEDGKSSYSEIQTVR